MADLTSRPYRPDPAKCCEACVFGRGDHAEWCEAREYDPFAEDHEFDESFSWATPGKAYEYNPLNGIRLEFNA